MLLEAFIVIIGVLILVTTLALIYSFFVPGFDSENRIGLALVVFLLLVTIGMSLSANYDANHKQSTTTTTTTITR